jgi:hypothetical protein
MRRRIALHRAPVEDRPADAFAVDADRSAWNPRLCQLNHRAAASELLANAQRAPVEPACRQIFAQRAGVNSESHRLDLFQTLEGDQQDGALRRAVNLFVAPRVPCDAFETLICATVPVIAAV